MAKTKVETTIKSVDQTYFIVKAVRGTDTFYLGYDEYSNTYTRSFDKMGAVQFATEERTTEVAHFHQSLAKFRGLEIVYSVLKVDTSETEIALEKRDYLKGNEVEIEIEDNVQG